MTREHGLEESAQRLRHLRGTHSRTARRLPLLVSALTVATAAALFWGCPGVTDSGGGAGSPGAALFSGDGPRTAEVRWEALLPAAGAEDPTSPVPADALGGLFADTLWDDGQAEVLEYAGVREIYGEPREYVLNMVVVKEEMDLRTLVKSDSPDDVDSVTVMQLHMTMMIDAGNYPYHQATSVYVDRANPFLLRKIAAASFEWCGTTTRTFWRRGDRLVGLLHSYFDGEADVVFDGDFGGAVNEEQLLVAARSLDLSREHELPLRMLESQTDNRVRERPLQPGVLRVGETGTADDAHGRAHRVRVVTFVPESGEEVRLEVELAPPNRVIRYRSPRTGELVLRSSERWAYWEHGAR